MATNDETLLSEAFGGEWPDSPLPVWKRLADAAKQHPDKLALACLHQPANLYGIESSNHIPDRFEGHLQWTYSQLDSAADLLSAGLLALGLAPGSSVVSILKNGVEFPMAFWAAHKMGCPFVPLNPRNLANLVVTGHLERGDTGNGGWITVADLLAIGERANSDEKGIIGTQLPRELELDSQDTVTILFTSGTTSLPKGCPHTNRTLNAFMKNLGLGGASPNDIFCSVLPNNHAMGYFFILHSFCNGGAVIYPSASYEPAAMARALALHKCTHTGLVPTALHSFLDYVEPQGITFPDVKDLCLAGSAITPKFMRQVIEVLGTQGYIGNDFGAESFYVEEDRTWFKTGDRGVMHPDGRVSIVGRYKDMIIRGGENIAPAAIEAVLNHFPGVEAQVVGAADSIAGEVPVALVRKLPAGDNPAGQLQDAVRQSMGMLHVPDEVITLETLGLEDYPRTASSKIQKGALRALVAAHRRLREPQPEAVNDLKGVGHANLNDSVDEFSHKPTEPRSIEETVLHVWWRATGIEPAKLDKEAPTFNFADSITIMRVRAMYRKELGVTLSVKEMSDNADLHSQIMALQRKGSKSKRDSAIQLSPPEQSQTLDEIQTIIGPYNSVEVFKEVATSALSKQGFDFDRDVENVIQTSDFIHVMEREKLINTWNFGISIVAEGSTVQTLKEALTTTLKNNPIWTSFYVHGEDKSPFYITMKPKRKLYDHCLIESGSVANVAELQHIAVNYPYPEHSVFPGPLFHALIYNIEDIQSAGFVLYVHHIVHDASSMRLMLEDLNKALLEPTQPLRAHVPYQLWADVYHSLRNSPRATFEVDWHVKRLANIHQHRKALYPPANVPRQEITSSPDGIDYGFDAPSLLNLKRHHSHITASVVLKAAMALVNITRTKHTHALFSNFEAARSSFPFWPDTLRHLPGANGSTVADLDASDVAGPTMNAVTNVIPVERSESAIAFLDRLQTEQFELTKRSHAPWRRIISALNELHPGENAGEMIYETHRTQFLTWVPGFLGDYEKIRIGQIAIRAALGLVFVAGLGGPQATTFMISLRWDVANYSALEVERFVKDVEKAIVWLLEEGNWEAPVSGFLDQFE
ncbi:hypothetical protein N0V90_008901 [Kalmusia sp. IMI 367209]|nr:hypothetical protein N0V90_008901 [Kalmusia sp. IMI 367209]